MRRNDEVISHWQQSVENLSASTLEFYRSVEMALTAKEAPVKPQRIERSEGGIFSAKREYLRVSYSSYAFDICAAPFGKDFFFSWWLIRPNADGGIVNMLAGIPVVGGFFARLLKPITYYSHDSYAMFQETVHRVVLDVVSGMLSINKMPPLTEAQRQAQRGDRV